VILPVASKVPVVRPVDKTMVLPEALVKRKEDVVKLAVPRLAVEILVLERRDPAFIPLLTVSVLIVAVVKVALDAPKEAVVILVLAIRVPVVRLGI
jgi:hypothetical protein